MSENTAEFYLEPAKKLHVRGHYDVLVAGAGTAGVVAAIAAARNGAKTVVIEKLPLPSGTMTNGGMVANSFYSTWTEEQHETRRVVEGIAMEIQERMIKEGGCPGATKHDPTTNSYRRPYTYMNDPETYKAVTSEMMMEAGVRVYLHTFLSDVVKDENGLPIGVIIESKSGREVLYAKRLIDCTGDADLAVKAGAKAIPFYQEYNVHPLASVGKMLGFANVDFDRYIAFCKEEGILKELRYGKVLGNDNAPVHIISDFRLSERLAPEYLKLGLRLTIFYSLHENTVDFVGGISRQNVNIIDLDEFSDIEMNMQILVMQLMDFLRKNAPGFEHAYIKAVGNQMGIRASRVIETEYVPSIEEITTGARYEDEIGLYGHSDFMPADPVSVMHNEGFYGVPYRMIIPKELENVLVAGRMVSTNLRSHMSTRNTVSCMIMGQAAGTAAALSIKQGVTPRALPYADLRAQLLQDGVMLE